MDDDREAYEFSRAPYLARQVDREAAQIIVEAAEAGIIGIEQAAEAGLIQINNATELIKIVVSK